MSNTIHSCHTHWGAWRSRLDIACISLNRYVKITRRVMGLILDSVQVLNSLEK